jgi:aminoglycoside phosphotransferase (APT) family kinase protein
VPSPAEPGPLLASGRDADIFELGPGLVLRRTKGGRVIEREARVMQYAAAQGYPVPRVEDVRAGGTEIVMERLEGPMMMDALTHRPDRMRRYAEVIADLHDRLHEIPAPDGLTQLDDGGDRLVHLDLHPMNVMMTPRGPVVIDWTNAARGEGLTDAALTYVLITRLDAPLPSPVRAAVQPLRLLLGRMFARRWRGPEFDARVAEAAELKSLTPNLSPREVERLLQLAARIRARTSG